MIILHAALDKTIKKKKKSKGNGVLLHLKGFSYSETTSFEPLTQKDVVF
jgi:hypothetical protein